MRCERRIFNFRYASPAHWIQIFRDFYGPTHKAFAALDGNGQHALERDLTALLEQMNTAGAALAGRARRVPRSRGHQTLRRAMKSRPLFADVSSIQRVNTRGGSVPAGACEPIGRVLRVPYTADYHFFATLERTQP